MSGGSPNSSQTKQTKAPGKSAIEPVFDLPPAVFDLPRLMIPLTVFVREGRGVEPHIKVRQADALRRAREWGRETVVKQSAP